MNDEFDNDDPISGAAVWLILILLTLAALGVGMVLAAGADGLVGVW